MIRIWRPRNLSSFQDPQPPLSIYVQNSSTSLTLDVQFQPTPTLTSPNDNQLIKRKYNPRWLFHFAEASLSAFSWLYALLCVVVQKYHEISFIYNYSHYWYLFCNQPVLFAQLENINKLWSNSRTVHVNERNQNQNKTNSRHIQIDHAFYCSI